MKLALDSRTSCTSRRCRVEDVDAWATQIREAGIAAKYGVRVTDVELQPWRMRDFVVIDPSGVLWRIGQNVD